jgi:hypothetical protein
MSEKTKIKFNVAELLTLDAELNGTEKFSGLLSLKLSLATKYHLTKVAKITGEERETFEKMRMDLIKELGTETEDGKISIPEIETIKGENGEPDKVQVHPKYIEFRTQLEELFMQEKEIEQPSLSIEDFSSLETEGNFPAFFKLLGLS